jgi:hypothetical protein
LSLASTGCASFGAESKYDRAIFFFNTDGVLQNSAYSKEEIAR